MPPGLLTDPRIAFDAYPPRRVVSLIPSVTASLFELGLGEYVVGITDFCTDPQEALAGIPRLGGPKNPRLDEIIRLNPDLVIANQEENDRASVEALAKAGINVWLTFPLTARAAVDDLWTLANLFRSERAMQQVAMLEKSMEWAELAAPEQPLRYFCPIWEDCLESGARWWMTFNGRTYPSDVLRILGGVNCFAERERRYPLLADLEDEQGEEPGERDTRYPRVGLAEILAAQPEVIILPSEPYSYSDENAQEFLSIFADTSAARAGRICLVDGTLLTWHGTRLARALEELPALFAQ